MGEGEGHEPDKLRRAPGLDIEVFSAIGRESSRFLSQSPCRPTRICFVSTPIRCLARDEMH